MTCERKEHYEQASDELREVFEWCCRNGQDIERLRVTSMPQDATAEDFHERVNQVSSDDLPPEADATPDEPPADPAPLSETKSSDPEITTESKPLSKPTKQPELFSSGQNGPTEHPPRSAS